MTLQDTVRFGVQSSPALKAVREDWRIAELEESNASVRFFPTLDLKAEHGIEKSEPSSSDSVWRSRASLELNETLYNNGLNLLALDAASKKREIGEKTFEDQREQLTLTIVKSFFAHSQAVHILEIRKKQQTSLENQLASIEAQYRGGVRTRGDYLRMKSELQRAQIATQTGERTVERTLIELKRVLGTTEDLAFAVEPVVKQVNVEVPRAAVSPGHRRYQLASLRRDLFQNTIEVQRKSLWPEWFLTGGLNYSTSDYLGTGQAFLDNDNLTAFAQVGLRFNLVDWGTRRRNLGVARSAKVRGENRIQEELNQFEALGKTSLLDLNQAVENFSLSRELLDLEIDGYGLLKKRYQSGKIGYLELIVGLRDLLSARISLVQNYFLLREAYYQSQYYRGKLSASFN